MEYKTKQRQALWIVLAILIAAVLSMTPCFYSVAYGAEGGEDTGTAASTSWRTVSSSAENASDTSDVSDTPKSNAGGSTICVDGQGKPVFVYSKTPQNSIEEDEASGNPEEDVLRDDASGDDTVETGGLESGVSGDDTSDGGATENNPSDIDLNDESELTIEDSDNPLSEYAEPAPSYGFAAYPWLLPLLTVIGAAILSALLLRRRKTPKTRN